MIKDHWIYQNRPEVTCPWAIYVIKEYTPATPFDGILLDVTIYSEQLDYVDNMASFLNWHYDTVTGYVKRLKDEIQAFGGEFDSEDAFHVERELCKLFFD